MQIKQWNAVNSLDFKEIKKKLKNSKSCFWKIRKNIDRIELEYKQFLYLIAVNPNETIVPWSQDVDDFWHQHILDTVKYAKDCDDVFGKFIHHNPHLPLGNKHKKSSEKTKILYKESFGKLKDKKENTNNSCGSSCSTSYIPILFCSTPCSDTDNSSSNDCSDSSSSDSGSSDSGSSCSSSSCSSCSGGGD